MWRELKATRALLMGAPSEAGWTRTPTRTRVPTPPLESASPPVQTQVRQVLRPPPTSTTSRSHRGRTLRPTRLPRWLRPQVRTRVVLTNVLIASNVCVVPAPSVGRTVDFFRGWARNRPNMTFDPMNSVTSRTSETSASAPLGAHR